MLILLSCIRFGVIFQLMGDLQSHVISGLDLRDGDSYRARVMVCNAARLCEESFSTIFMVMVLSRSCYLLCYFTSLSHAPDYKEKQLLYNVFKNHINLKEYLYNTSRFSS